MCVCVCVCVCEIAHLCVHVRARFSQYQITRKALSHNTLVALPTGLGKTLIAAVVMYNYWRWYPTGQIIFMAPTKPLVEQQMEACHRFTDIPQSDMVKITGTTVASKRGVNYAQHRIFFATPQSIVSDIQRSALKPERVHMQRNEDEDEDENGRVWIWV